MKRGKRSRGRKSPPKQTLNLPDLDQARSAVAHASGDKPGIDGGLDQVLTQPGTGTVRMWRALPIKSTMAQWSSRVVEGGRPPVQRPSLHL